jgi:hypothetical protein
VAEVGHRVHVRQDRVAQAGWARREQVGPVQGNAGGDPRMIRPQLGAEIDAFLAVRPPRRQLAPDGEPTPPRTPAAGHGDAGLLLVREAKEFPGQRLEAALQAVVHGVADDVEEAHVAAGGIDLPRHLVAGRAAVPQSGDIDHRKAGHRQPFYRPGGRAGGQAGGHRTVRSLPRKPQPHSSASRQR